MCRLLVLAVIVGSVAPAAADRLWSVQLGEGLGLEGGPGGMIEVTATEVQLGYRVRGGTWLYGAAAAGSSGAECGDCGMGTGTVRAARTGAMYLACGEHDVVCAGFSAGIGYEHRRIGNDLVLEAGPPGPDFVIDNVLVGEGRAHLRVWLADDFPLAIEASIAVRYLRVVGDYESANTGGVLASLGLVARM